MKAKEIVLDKIKSMIESGQLPWTRPSFGFPKTNFCNYDPKTKKIKNYYKGLNMFLLSSDDEMFYLTFNQIKKLKGKLKKGSKARMVYYFEMREKKDDNRQEGELPELYPVARYYNVFRLSDVEGVEPPKMNSEEKGKASETVVQYVDKVGAVIEFGSFDCGSYNLKKDVLEIPHYNLFKSEAHYLKTILHELIHWSGSDKRLKRLKSTDSKTEEYGYEELVAELGAAILANRFGVDQIDQSAAYIKGWQSRLSKNVDWLAKAIHEAEQSIVYLDELANRVPIRKIA